MHTDPDPNFAAEIARLRPMLVKLARRQLRNHAWAEDAVSETLVAALERPEAFAGRAQARTWVVGILKHKLVDQVRRHTRECQFQVYDDDDADSDDVVHAAGHDAPAAWGDPLAALARRQFVNDVSTALQALPAKQGRAFAMCEWQDRDTAEACSALDVTPNHLGVILHRAKRRLREAIAPHWAGGAPLLA
jgi:RNA polymerase sigma-70 factor (TIGR02943 family)